MKTDNQLTKIGAAYSNMNEAISLNRLIADLRVYARELSSHYPWDNLIQGFSTGEVKDFITKEDIAFLATEEGASQVYKRLEKRDIDPDILKNDLAEIKDGIKKYHLL